MSILSLPRQSIYTGSLILVNAAHGYHEQEHDDLLSIPEDEPAFQEYHTPAAGTASAVATNAVLLNRRAATLLCQLIQSLGGWGTIVPVSGWRSRAEQQTIWDDSMTQHGEEFTRTFVAIPGHSEHETGLAIDLGKKSSHIDFIRPEFPYDGVCGAFRRLAASYGFVERYPAGKEQVTGIGYEPWHFRYVGVPHAFIMTEHDLVLEEYMDFLRNYPLGGSPYHYQNHGLDISVSYQKAPAKGSTSVHLDDTIPYSVSGNNVDGFIITEWRNHHADR